MHNTAYKNGERFFNNYCSDSIENKVVLDIGSYDVNGTLKPIFSNAKKYIGLDQFEGPNVDMISSSHEIPLEDSSIDIIISSSCFEHDDFFWLTFLEMSRLLKPSGFIYIQAPSNGPYHAFPTDNWRFYADSWKCLEKWAVKNNYNIKLVESYIDKENAHTDPAFWEDSVGIYKKL